MNICNNFFQGRDELYENYRQFSEKHNLNIINKLREEKNETNFLSLISEINFGLFFDKLCTNIWYDKKFDEYKPDWTLKLNDQKIIAEVMRLNPAEDDRIKINFEEDLSQRIRTIKTGCILELKYDEKKYNLAEYNSENTFEKVRNWIVSSPSSGESLMLLKGIKITLLGYEDTNNALFCVSGGQITQNFVRLDGDNSPLLIKAKKYSNTI